MILSFELTMPNVGSWNGVWTGADRKYYKHRNVPKQKALALLDGEHFQNFYYDFGDGWGANVQVEQVDSREKRKREKVSAGFYGYDWMIDSILKYGEILTES